MYEAPIKDLNFVIKNIIDLKKLSEVDDWKSQDFDVVVSNQVFEYLILSKLFHLTILYNHKPNYI